MEFKAVILQPGHLATLSTVTDFGGVALEAPQLLSIQISHFENKCYLNFNTIGTTSDCFYALSNSRFSNGTNDGCSNDNNTIGLNN